MKREEFNIVYLIGNGFDISVLNQFSYKNTSYTEFYNFLQEKKKEGIMSNNSVLDRVERDKASGKENWSDFEETTGEMLLEGNYEIDKLKKDFEEFQYKFSEFLYDLVTPNLLQKLDSEFSQRGMYKLKNKTEDRSRAEDTLFYFMNDIENMGDAKNMNLKESIDHKMVLNYTFFNFNYTSLFDSYIYLDKNVFDPKKYKKGKNNCEININPRKFEGLHSNNPRKFVEIKNLDVIHPHGQYMVPRSMLFGIEERPGLDVGKYKYFIKSYWNQKKDYYSILKEANLFIIYGMSLGKSDANWWREIIARIYSGARLIIYIYEENGDKDAVIRKFLEYSYDQEKVKENIEEFRKRIIIVFHKGKDVTAFNVSPIKK